MPQNGAAADRLPVLLRRPVEHRHPVRLRPQQQRRRSAAPDDAFGFGFFPGQFGMAVYSMYPIDTDDVRTFQHFLWKDMPGALLPDDPATPAPADWYSPDGARRLPPVVEEPLGRADRRSTARPCTSSSATRRRRSSTVPRTATARATTTRSASGPTTSRPGTTSRLHLRRRGRAPAASTPGEPFVIAGDQNADPLDGDSVPGAIQQLLEHPRVNTKLTPASDGRRRGGRRSRAARTSPTGATRAFDTADFADAAPGNLRADYVLPVARPCGSSTRARLLAASRPTRCSAWSASSRSRARTTARSGSTSPCPVDPRRPAEGMGRPACRCLAATRSSRPGRE